MTDMLFLVLKNELFGSPLSCNTKIDAEKLYILSKYHDVSHLVSDSLIRNGIVLKGSELYEKLNKERFVAIYRRE